MVKGPLGGPRPLANEEMRITIRDGRLDANIGIRGPLGAGRPLAHPNPPQNVSEENFVEACKNSEWAQDMVEGLDRFVGGGITEQRKQEIMEENCEDLSQGIRFPISEQFKDRVLGREVR